MENKVGSQTTLVPPQFEKLRSLMLNSGICDRDMQREHYRKEGRMELLRKTGKLCQIMANPEVVNYNS